MSQKWIIHNLFEDIPFSKKVKMTYFQWCKELLKISFSKKLYHHIKTDMLYYRHYMSIEILSYIGYFIVWLSNIFLFPIYAFILKQYWSKRYSKAFSDGEEPLCEIIMNSVTNPVWNGLKIVKILEKINYNNSTHYSVLLENKEIVNVDHNEMLFKNTLLIKKDALEKDLMNINYQLSCFEKKDN